MNEKELRLSHLADELSLLDPQDRACFFEAAYDFLHDEETHLINESLSKDEIELVDAIVRKFDRLIKGGLLLSFIGIRQQVKSVQRELADARKQIDRFEKKAIKEQTEAALMRKEFRAFMDKVNSFMDEDHFSSAIRSALKEHIQKKSPKK